MWRTLYSVTVCAGPPAVDASRTSTSCNSWNPLGPRIGPMIWPGCASVIMRENALGISSRLRQPRSPPSSALGLSE